MTGFPLTVVVLAKNEEHNIERCLRSVDWCDELVVVDDFSSDRTAQIAIAMGARVLQRQFDNFAEQRNWALREGKLRNEWVLMLDADEVATDGFRSEIERTLAATAPDVSAFSICRKTMFLGRWLKYSDGFPVWIMRLVRRGSAYFVSQGHGEIPVPCTSGYVARITEPLLHFPFSKGLSDWLNRHNRYSTAEASFEILMSRRLRWQSLFSADRAKRREAVRDLSRKLPGRPVLRFAYQYFGKLGSLDGRAGLTFCMLMAFYEAMIVAKRMELESLASSLNLKDSAVGSADCATAVSGSSHLHS